MITYRVSKFLAVLLLAISSLGAIPAFAAPLVINNMSTITVTCVSDVTDALTTCSFNLPNGITSIPSNLHLAIGTDVDPEGFCVQNNTVVNCDGVPVGRINNTQIYANIGTGQSVQTGGNVEVLTVFTQLDSDTNDALNTEQLLNQFGQLDTGANNTLEDNTVPDNTQNTNSNNSQNNPNTTNTGTNNLVLIRTGGAAIGLTLLILITAVATSLYLKRQKGIKKSKIKIS
jgi:hypothetical protein